MKLLLAVSAAVATTAMATPPLPPPAQRAAPPKLIVAISIDQLSADLFDEYRGRFTGGLARLAGGTVFRNGYQAQNATETCPGHSTLLTGARPARTGIIANGWFDLTQSRSDKYVYCAEDERVAGTSSSEYRVSPVHLRTLTLGEHMDARDPATRVVAVAGKEALFGFFVGQTMKAMQGKANPQVINERLKSKLA